MLVKVEKKAMCEKRSAGQVSHQSTRRALKPNINNDQEFLVLIQSKKQK